MYRHKKRQKKIEASVRFKYGLENQFTFSKRVTGIYTLNKIKKEEKNGGRSIVPAEKEENREGRVILYSRWE